MQGTNKIFLLIVSLFLMTTQGTANANDYPLGERSIFSEARTQERMTPVGKVCIEGQECAHATASATVAQATQTQEPLTPESIYSSKCQACHASGMMGAPKPGEDAWQQRLAEKGLDTLVQHAINGINSMPPRGMCTDCSDDDIKATIEYMINFGK